MADYVRTHDGGRVVGRIVDRTLIMRQKVVGGAVRIDAWAYDNWCNKFDAICVIDSEHRRKYRCTRKVFDEWKTQWQVKRCFLKWQVLVRHFKCEDTGQGSLFGEEV